MPYIAILRGELWRSNVDYKEEPYDFYRLIGFAYSTNKLGKLRLYGYNDKAVWIYVIDGVPQVLDHDPYYDQEHAYAKLRIKNEILNIVSNILIDHSRVSDSYLAAGSYIVKNLH